MDVSDQIYKKQHEAFVSDLKGTTMSEVLSVSLCVPILVMLYRTVEAVVERISGKKMGKIMSSIVQLLIFGGGYIGSLCLPDLFISTPSALFSVFILLLLLILDAKRGWRGRVMKTPFVFVDEYRGSLLLLTAVAILAVDFPVFPRRFAKTETFGHSIMDMGVGSFVFANAIVSGAARSIPSKTPTTSSTRASSGPEPDQKKEKEGERGREMGRGEAVKKAVMGSIPLLVLGLGRLLATKSVEYHEHASEYGVHWNFFITLAVIGVGSSAILSTGVSPLFSGLLLLILHQLALSSGLQDWTLNAPREDLISMNKEGIVSCGGYIALFLLGVWAGRSLRSLSTLSPVSLLSKELWKLWILDALLWVISMGLERFVDASSRRLVNATYVVFVLSYNLFLLLSLLTLDILFPSSKSSSLMLSLNFNALFFFLISNVATGCVNLSVRTLYTPDHEALVILGTYVSGLVVVSMFLFSQRIRLKFW